jgi:hypothetical protein
MRLGQGAGEKVDDLLIGHGVDGRDAGDIESSCSFLQLVGVRFDQHKLSSKLGGEFFEHRG